MWCSCYVKKSNSSMLQWSLSYYRVILLGLSHKIAVSSCYKLINSVKYLREAHSVVAFGVLCGHVITHWKRHRKQLDLYVLNSKYFYVLFHCCERAEELWKSRGAVKEQRSCERAEELWKSRRDSRSSDIFHVLQVTVICLLGHWRKGLQHLHILCFWNSTSM